MAGSKLNVRFYVTQANVRFPCDFSVYRSFAKDRGAAGMEKLCGNGVLAFELWKDDLWKSRNQGNFVQNTICI